MHHLPAIDNASHRLPLADSTLLRLAEGALCEDAGQRIQLLRQAMLDDAALSLWSVCYAWSRQGTCLKSVSEAANWLEARGLAAVVAEVETVVPGDISWTACVRESIARRIAAAATGDSDDAQFAALLSNIGQWRQLAAVGQANAECLSGPAWLMEQGIRDVQVAEPSPEAEELMAAWECEQPIALPLFQRATAMRQKLTDMQQHWDEEFLREKLASLKEFTYGASHELNNPLFNISSRAQVLLRDEPDPERRRKLSTIYAHAMRASDMINDIALAARLPRPDFAAVEPVAVVGDVVAELQSAAEEQATGLTFEHVAGMPVIEADASQLAMAVREIIINALESLKRSTRRGKVVVAMRTDEDGIAEITVVDNGPGLDARARRHLFDPFFSGYEAGRGLGFGLTKCWQIVQAHSGAIVVDSQPESGTTITLRLPASQRDTISKT